jgi:thiamine-monophosphate kinase
MPTERLADLGEFGLLARIRARLGSSYLGDDAAVLPRTAGMELLATVDAQVDGVHFLRERMVPQQVGRRAIAVNVSDIAAMGGLPRFALVSLLVPADLSVAWIEALYDGIRQETVRWEMQVVGGNISGTPGPLTLDVAVLGEVETGCALTRRGARPGDPLFVTGDLGRAAVGLHLLRRGESGSLVDAYCTPVPRVGEGRALLRSRLVHAAMDLSDGLGSDLYRLCEESQVGAVIEVAALPISGEVRAAAATVGLDPVGLALFGGEDFELVVAAASNDAGTLQRVVAEVGTPLTVIGEVRPAGEGVTVHLPDGSKRPLAGGWDHFPGRHA